MEKLEITILRQQDIEDFSALVNLFSNVFEWTDTYVQPTTHLQSILNKPNFVSIVVKTEGLVIGGLTGHVLDRYDHPKPSMYLYDLAVLEPYQRQGIGKRLIKSLLNHCQHCGYSEAFVQADLEDAQAVQFYRGTPISSEMQATHFTYTL